MAMETGSSMEKVHGSGGGDGSFRGRAHLLCLYLGRRAQLRLSNMIFAPSIRLSKYNWTATATPASLIQCRSRKFGYPPLVLSSIFLVAVAKVDIQPIQPILKLQLVIALPRGPSGRLTKGGSVVPFYGLYRECRREAEVTGTLTLHASSDMGCDVYR